MKNAYLTIDDSPSENMDELIRLLEVRDLPAVFFCIGKNLKRRPELALSAIQKGFILGNHSYSHPHFSNLSIEQAFLEIQKTDKLLDELYKTAGVERSVRWFRFPYGDKGDGRKGQIFKPLRAKGAVRANIIQTLLNGLGYSIPAFSGIQYAYYNTQLAKDTDWHWTFDLMEWATAQRHPTFGIRGLEQVLDRINAAYPRDCRGKIEEKAIWLQHPSDEIILLHDHKKTTHLIAPILDELSRKGLKFQIFKHLQ